MTGILDEFASYAEHEMGGAPSAEVVHHAKRAVIDWFAALYPGTTFPVVTDLVRAHARETGFGRSSLPAFATTAFPATAAWINGTASHAAEFDDIFRDAVYHPGSPTIAAALAVAEDESRSGLDLLKAVIVGYEISTRIGVAVQPSHYRFFHTTGTVGCFGSAAAAAALINPDSGDVMHHSLATAATFASGLQQAFRSESMTKALHGGHAASVGVTAAKGASAGITGALDILEGAAGFGAAMSDGADWTRATDGLGQRYNIAQMTQKNHGCCGHTFAAIDAVVLLRREIGAIDPARIRSIAVETYQTAIDVTGNFDPRTANEARFSLPYVVCHAMLHGSVRLNAFAEYRLGDQAIRQLMQRVSLKSDPKFTAGFPSMRAARVTITMDDGKEFRHFSPYRRGDPESPLTDAELDEKFDELVAPVIGVSRAADLRDKLWRLESLDLAELKLVKRAR